MAKFKDKRTKEEKEEKEEEEEEEGLSAPIVTMILDVHRLQPIQVYNIARERKIS